MSIEQTAEITRRTDVAEAAAIETIGTGSVEVGSEMLPWVKSELSEIPTAEVVSDAGNFRFGNIIGENPKLMSLAQREMRGNEHMDDQLNRLMYTGIQKILQGNPGSLKRVQNAPAGTAIYYDGLRSGARIFFTDIGSDEDGKRIFLKTAICASKKSEAVVLGTLSGKGKKEKV
ncbi:hypothetical protein KC968_00040 [Candidatus Saccharibacteria bacterium]|nr:hypothetical protein [Candidatus Saccharibacteria bacterium]